MAWGTVHRRTNQKPELGEEAETGVKRMKQPAEEEEPKRQQGGRRPLVAWRSDCGRSPTSHLALQAQDDLHGLLQDEQLGLGLVALQVHLTHAAQLPERLVNVAHAHALPNVIGPPPLALALFLLLRGQALVRRAAGEGKPSPRGGEPGPSRRPLRPTGLSERRAVRAEREARRRAELGRSYGRGGARFGFFGFFAGRFRGDEVGAGGGGRGGGSEFWNDGDVPESRRSGIAAFRKPILRPNCCKRT